jgi:hypothetical protein
MVGARWIREGLGGLRWRLPSLPRERQRERDQVGAARPLFVTVLATTGLVVVAVATVATGGLGGLSGRAGDPGAAGRPTCVSDTPRSTSLLVDLGVTAATGDAEDPLRSQEEVDLLVARAAEAGADVISTDVGWRTGPDTTPDLTGLDRVLAATAEHGLAVRVQLTGVAWRPPTTRAQLASWRAFVADTLRHLAGRAAYVEVWNEPDNPRYWRTGPDARAFVRLLEETAPLVRRLAPEAQIVTGGLGGNDIGFLEQVYDELGSAPRPFDLVGVHPFSGSRPPWSDDASGRYAGAFGDYDENFTGFTSLLDVMEDHGDGDLGLYLGEFGYSTRPHDGYVGIPDDERAALVSAAFDTASCSASVVAMSWYALHPTRWDRPAWTLLDASGRPGATYDALRQWTQLRDSRDAR